MNDEIVEVTKHMLATPADWPIWPVLPLKRYTTPGAFPEMGYVVGDPVWPLNVYTGNIFRISPDDPIVGEYASVQHLLDAGWVID